LNLDLDSQTVTIKQEKAIWVYLVKILQNL
jgi:hypothetical protein